MTNLIQNISFQDTKCNFERKLNDDIRNKIKKRDSLLIPADKTTNFYTMNPSSYDKLLEENVTKVYKKASDNLVATLDTQSTSLAKQLKRRPCQEISKKGGLHNPQRSQAEFPRPPYLPPYQSIEVRNWCHK